MKTMVFAALLAVAGIAYGGQVYKWVDEKGVVNYTPYPPPANIKNVEEKKIGGNSIQTGDLPYAVKMAAKDFPLTLYVTSCGELCDKARAYLKKRGVPFTEKNPQQEDEIENFKKLSGGGMEVPVLVVGTLKTLKGFNASDWDAILDQAGYPSATPTAPTPAQ